MQEMERLLIMRKACYYYVVAVSSKVVDKVFEYKYKKKWTHKHITCDLSGNLTLIVLLNIDKISPVANSMKLSWLNSQLYPAHPPVRP